MPPVLLEAKLHTVGKQDPLHFTIRAVSMSIVQDQMSVDQTPGICTIVCNRHYNVNDMESFIDLCIALISVTFSRYPACYMQASRGSLLTLF